MKKKILDLPEMKKLEVHSLVRILDYGLHSVLNKTIIKRTTGNITVFTFDKGEELALQVFPFDNYIQIIDGSAEILIDKKKYTLEIGEGIIIPAFSRYCFSARHRFKMISTIIKSGYED